MTKSQKIGFLDMGVKTITGELFDGNAKQSIVLDSVRVGAAVRARWMRASGGSPAPAAAGGDGHAATAARSHRMGRIRRAARRRRECGYSRPCKRPDRISA